MNEHQTIIGGDMYPRILTIALLLSTSQIITAQDTQYTTHANHSKKITVYWAIPLCGDTNKLDFKNSEVVRNISLIALGGGLLTAAGLIGITMIPYCQKAAPWLDKVVVGLVGVVGATSFLVSKYPDENGSTDKFFFVDDSAKPFKRITIKDIKEISAHSNTHP